MKKRQELQQQISDLNVQLRQHQIELRKEKQQAKIQGSVATSMEGRAGILKAEIKNNYGANIEKKKEMEEKEEKVQDKAAETDAQSAAHTHVDVRL